MGSNESSEPELCNLKLSLHCHSLSCPVLAVARTAVFKVCVAACEDPRVPGQGSRRLHRRLQGPGKPRKPRFACPSPCLSLHLQKVGALGGFRKNLPPRATRSFR